MTRGTLRPLPGQDARAWTRDVFAAGDHAGAAMFGDPATWQFHAARALLLGDAPSFAALAQFDAPEARFHGAAARWVHGDTARARAELHGLDAPGARRLRELLGRERIQVLAQLPWLPGAVTDLLGGARADRQFDVRNIGHRDGDLQNRPYADVQRLLDDGFAPDFFVAAMVEWHHVPPDLQTLPCPLFGHVADHDLHVQTIRPWLDLFDELCVTDRTEWLDVQGLGRGTVASFPQVFGLPARLAPVPDAPRHLDFFVSGTMVDPYHPDKAKVLHELLAMRDITMRVVRGFTGPLAFQALLGASKASFTFVRRPGAMPTRGLESLALGCAVALQQESVLNLWVGANEGVVPYGARPGELAAAVREILGHWDHFGPAARRGAELVRREFAMPTVASRYLRFLTVRAAQLHERPRRVVDTTAWPQKRLCVSRTWLPDNPMVRRRSMQATFRRLGAQIAQRPTARAIVDMARELLCEFVFYEQRDQAGADERTLRDDAVRLLEKCCRSFPDHLAARFVLVRALWHHGDAAARHRALLLAAETLDADPARWRVAAADDVMPFDFHADCFNYRDYLDLVAAAEKGQMVAAGAFVQLIRASLAGYLARKTGRVALHEQAVALDPGFARYRLDLARCLLARGGDDARLRARTLLVELANGSGAFTTAAREVQRQWPADANALLGPVTASALRRLEEDTIDAGVSVPALFAVERREPAAAGQARDAAPGGGDARVAVLLPWVPDTRSLHELLAEVDGQTAAAAVQVVVGVPPDARGLAAALAGRAGACGVATVGAGAGWAERLAACAALATAPALFVLMPGDRLRPDALEVLADALDDDPAAALVFANEGWTTVELARFEPSACAAFTCAPPAAERRLATTDGIGLHPLWRRSLHAIHGTFDPAFGPATEHEFWLRVLRAGRAHQLPLALSTSAFHAPWRRLRDPAAEPAALARALAAHGLRADDFAPQRPLPATLLAAGLREEATSHARLGVITDAERRDLASLEQFFGTALLHGDVETALCLLRAAIASAPHLLAPRLALAELLRALGRDARAVLLAARTCRPYDAVLDRRLAEPPLAAAPSSTAAIAPANTHANAPTSAPTNDDAPVPPRGHARPREVLPCPT